MLYNAENKTVCFKKIFSYKFVIIMIRDISLEIKGYICVCPETELLIPIILLRIHIVAIIDTWLEHNL